MVFYQEKKKLGLVHDNYITCMTKINKGLDDEKAVQMLILGTEHCQVLFLEPNGQVVKQEVVIPSQPVQLVSEGQFDVDYKVFALCRNGSVC